MTAPISSSTPRPRLRALRHYASHVRPVGRDLLRWYRGRSSSEHTYGTLRRMHVRTAGLSSAALLAAMRATPGAADHVDRRELRAARRAAGAALDELRELGITVVDPVLDGDGVARLRAFAEHAPAHVRLADGRVVVGTYADRPPDAVSLAISGTFAWAQPDVQRVMADQRLHQLALARFGLAPVVHTPTIYWSCTRPSDAHDEVDDAVLARTFHMDFDGVQAVRVHVYLTDVDHDSAPMQYVPGSHRVGSLRGRERLSADSGLDERIVEERFGPAPGRSVTGPAGTTFVTDPRGLHRGTTPRGRDRLFLVLPIQAGSFAGYVWRRRSVPVRDDAFGRMLTAGSHGPLRLFEAASDGTTDEGQLPGVVRLAR